MKNFTKNRWLSPSSWMGLTAIIMTIMAFSPQLVTAQCTASSTLYGSGNAPSIGNNVNITTCAYAGERSTINSVTSGETYVVSYSGNAAPIVTIFNASQVVVASGASPVTFTASASGTYYSQGNTTGCGTASGCNTVNWSNTTTISCPWPDTLSVSATYTTAAADWVEMGSATSWQVSLVPMGDPAGSGTPVVTTSNPYSFTGLTANLQYDFYVRAICAVGDTSAWSSAYTFTTGYCTPAPASVDGQGIVNVTMGSINNSTGAEPGHYGDYSAMVTNAYQSTSLNIAITYQTGYTYYTWAWADWNNDLDFDDAGEAFYIGNSSNANPTTIMNSLPIPATAVLGNIRIRLGGSDGGLGTTPPSTPCYTGSYASFEDYTLNILPAPTCPWPDTLTVASITSTGASLGWAEMGSATAWHVEYGPDGFTQGSAAGTLVYTGSNPLAITGLSPINNYQFYVRSICGAADSSVWIGPMNFTTNCTGPMTGVYTLDPASPITVSNYQTMDSFIQHLNICGLGGAVTLNVAANSGPYVGPWDFGVITGSSATNTVTINGNGNVVNKNVSENHFVRFEGTSYFTINDFEFINQTPNTAMFGVQMRLASDHISITNNTIDIGTGYTSSLSSCITASNSITSATSYGNNASNVTISGNEMIGGYYGMVLNGTNTTTPTQGHTVSNNNIHDFYYYGLRMYYADSLVIDGNELSRANRATITTFYGMYGYYVTNAKFKNNRIHSNGASTSTAYPFYLSNSNNSTGSETEFINNAVYNLQSTGTIYAMYLTGTRNFINMYHNTVEISSAGTGTRRGIYFSGAPNNHNVKNNIVQISGAGTGTATGIYSSSTSASFSTDYNVVNVNASGTNYFGYYSGNRADLAAWQTGTSDGANSSESNPVFADVANGNFSPLSLNIDNMATLVGVTTDIDGTTRNATTPDVGAIEFTGIPGDLEMTNAALGQVSACYGSADSAYAQVTNLLGSTVDFSTDPLTIVWNVTGPINTTDSLVVNAGTMAVGSDSIFSISSIDMSTPGDYMVSAYIKPNAVNASLLNDSIWNVYTETVQPIITASPDSVTVTSPFDMPTLSSSSPLYPAGAFFITERCQWAGTSTNQPVGGKPSWMGNCDDYIEVTGVPNSSLEGFTYELWTGTTQRINYTFGPGTLIGPNGTAIIGTYLGTSSPANYFYAIPAAVDYSTSSSTSSGHILKDASGNIVDVLGYNTQTFSAATGVTAADWTGTTVSGGSSWGIRLTGADMNDNTGWVKAQQDPNTVNAGVTVPAPTTVAGIVWDSAGTTVGTTPNIDAGAFTMSGVYPYIVTYTNVCGTYSDSSIVTVDLTNATITASTNVSCNAGDDGTATVTAGGGDAPYTYMWSNGDTTMMADTLMAGTYTVTVYDANMWPATAMATITEPTAITATTSTTPSTCGVPSGSATVVATGGTGTLSYLWSSGATTATATGLVGGSYDVTVTDANMCTAVFAATVSDIGAPVITIAVDNIVTCFGDSTGQVTATGVGGTTPYAFAWSSGGTAATEAGLPMGVFTVQLTDATGCISNGTVNMTQNPALLAVVTGSTDPLCNGDATGTATSIAGGGVAPYSYLWSNGDATANASALAAGTHSVMVTDAVGCMQSANVNISQPNQLGGVFVNVMDVSCNGGTTGSAGILATGGTAPYSYGWSNGNTGSNATALSSGSVSVTVTDANNCSMVDNVTIAEPTALVATTTGATDAACFGGNTGTATATAAGGTMPYVYAWSNGAGGTLATGLMAGTYTVSVNDANNCSSTATISVGQPAMAVSVAVTSTNASCNGISDGGATAMGAGGTAGYSYSWSNGGSTAAISGLAAGSYAVTTTDANGCMSSASASVTEPTMLMASATATDVTCNGGNDGQTMAMATGGTAPYSFVWNNGPTTALNDTVMAGTYSAVVMDANGCMANASAMVSEPMPVMVNLGADVTICDADVFTLDAGAGYASYAWDDASTAQTRAIDAAVAGPGAADYSVSVLTAAGCEGSDTITVTVADPVTTAIIINGSKAICQYESTSMDAGPGFASYTWSNTSNSQTINIYAASQTVGMNTFTVTVTDANGCEGTAMETVEVYPEVIFSLAADTTVWKNAVYTIEADSGYASYTWNTGATTQNLDVTTAGTYSVVVTDSLTGCAASDEMVVDFALSVEGATAAQLKLYPNPAVDFINIEFSNFASQGVVEIKVLSVTGQLVKTVNVDVSASNGSNQIDVSQLAVGTYMIQFDYDGQNIVKQFTIK